MFLLSEFFVVRLSLSVILSALSTKHINCDIDSDFRFLLRYSPFSSGNAEENSQKLSKQNKLMGKRMSQVFLPETYLTHTWIHNYNTRYKKTKTELDKNQHDFCKKKKVYWPDVNVKTWWLRFSLSSSMTFVYFLTQAKLDVVGKRKAKQSK